MSHRNNDQGHQIQVEKEIVQRGRDCLWYHPLYY